MRCSTIAGAMGLGLAAIAGATLVLALAGFAAQSPATDEAAQYANAHPYFEDPLPQLVKRLPELKHLDPAGNQADLPDILQKTGERVDDFFRHITDLTAREEISLLRFRQELPTSRPELTSERVRDSYLILRRGGPSRSEIVEYRTDAKGDRYDQTLVKRGYIVTSGFALDCNYFATGFQGESTFRYLGEQQLGARKTYVIGFAQQPGKATLTIRMRGRSGDPVHMLVQGIAWIDKSNYQIVQLRTDLLAPRWDVGLNQQTTEVTLNRVQLADIASPLWLPSSVKVFVEFTTHNGDVDEFYEVSYRNEHRYSDYQRYRVATRVVP